MVFYFSGTGNSKWVAEEIARKINDIAIDITGLKQPPELDGEKYIGLVFPIYAWGVAEPMLAFARKLPPTNAYHFGVCTCGEDAGFAMKKLSKNLKMQSCYSIVMPSNYIVGADIDSDEMIINKIAEAKQEINTIVSEIINKKVVYRVNEGSFAFVKTNIASKAFNKFARNTTPFYADEKCIACGLCEKQCPAHTITMVNAKPKWDMPCYQCLKCINSCPKQAIQYGENTSKRGRYTLEKWIDKT